MVEVLPKMTAPEYQAWIAEQLNLLPWTKIDVDCRHMHSHAGIVVRIPRRFTERDQITYVIEELMSWG